MDYGIGVKITEDAVLFTIITSFRITIVAPGEIHVAMAGCAVALEMNVFTPSLFMLHYREFNTCMNKIFKEKITKDICVTLLLIFSLSYVI